LEEVLVAYLGASVTRYCELSQRCIVSFVRFAEHVARDLGDIAQVRALG
jgi:hypothetical protein